MGGPEGVVKVLSAMWKGRKRKVEDGFWKLEAGSWNMEEWIKSGGFASAPDSIFLVSCCRGGWD